MLTDTKTILVALLGGIFFLVESEGLRAETTCRVRMRIVFFQEDGDSYIPLKGLDKTILNWQDSEVKDWKDCFNEAENLAEEYNAHDEYELTVGEQSHVATGYRYAEWEIKDGILWSLRTSGRLTKFTHLFFNPSKNDVRVFEINNQYAIKGTPNRRGSSR